MEKEQEVPRPRSRVGVVSEEREKKRTRLERVKFLGRRSAAPKLGLMRTKVGQEEMEIPGSFSLGCRSGARRAVGEHQKGKSFEVGGGHWGGVESGRGSRFQEKEKASTCSLSATVQVHAPSKNYCLVAVQGKPWGGDDLERASRVLRGKEKVEGGQDASDSR